MPVRIYDIAKNLGVESKQVLSKAKQLGITGAKVASSSIDKITAEFLEAKMREDVEGPPQSSEREAEAPASDTPAPMEAPVLIVAQEEPEPERAEPEPEEEPAAAMEDTLSSSTQQEEPDSEKEPEMNVEPVGESSKDDGDTEAGSTPEEASKEVEAEPSSDAPPAEKTPEKEDDPKHKLGAKVGFIELTAGSVRSRDRGRSSRERRSGAKGKEGEAAAGAPSPAPAQKTTGTGDRRGGGYDRGPRPGQGQGQGQRGSDFGNRRGQQGQRPGDRRDHRGGYQDSRSQGGREREQQKPAPAPKKEKYDLPDDAPSVSMKPPIVVRSLAEKISLKPFQVIADLMGMGVFAKINESINQDAAIAICAKHGFRFEVERRDKAGHKAPVTQKAAVDISKDKEEDLQLRAPVVTIMGHVDHGKTTLLDYIRKSNVVGGEAGGITQHIGAYTIDVPHPEDQNDIRQITFLDTPGHAAFSAMRARGADVTDVVILVVAADDGLMPQTLEALNHAQASGAPIIVAVNKCDHPAADPLKVRQQFQQRSVTPEEWGGDTIFVDVSALKGDGVDHLLGMVLLTADILELKANPKRGALGNIVESGLEPGGPAATALVRNGTLNVGDVIVCETFWGKVRALIGEDGSRVKNAGPSMAVKILGLNGVPEAGSEFHTVKKEREAKDIVEERVEEAKQADVLRKSPKVTLESLMSQMSESDVKELRLIVKADAQGSVEAIVQALDEIDSSKVDVNFIHAGVGSITESDVLLASASTAIVLGFHTKLDPGSAALAKRHGVQIKQYAIIYELIDEVRDSMAGLLDPETKETVLGTADVKQIFPLSKGGKVAGCIVSSGRIQRGKARVLRNGHEVVASEIQTLKRFQDDVNEVRNGQECGIRILGFDELREGDVIESFAVESVAAKL